MREANLASMPLDICSSFEIVNKEHNLLSTFAGHQTGNKDRSPADDAKTSPQLTTQAQTEIRLECLLSLVWVKKLPKPETTVAQKSDLSSRKGIMLVVAQKSDLSSRKGILSANCWSTKVESPRAVIKFSTPTFRSTTPLSETRGSSCETILLAYFLP
ncbi:hypothetical protein Bca4012_071302 [Brassica carinata]|uniref:Uncharacterized protein n=1 Tax=Brassica carinata TaxID=52824 RepID=A0A8X7U7T9_BRACI|nr:hypothetical protein Bca52824_063582 [Brassica carinata]